MQRIYTEFLQTHFLENRQMLYLMGPRQVGKTTCGTLLENNYENWFYYDWDNQNHRDLILLGANAIATATNMNALATSVPFIIFDEIHKYPKWKTFLKGFYDTYPNQADILVMGSSQLDTFNRGGDSLMGRYFRCRVHPFSVAECIHTNITLDLEGLRSTPAKIDDSLFENLWQFGGYPDPLIKANTRFYNKWASLRQQLLFKEDIRDLTRVQELSQIEHLAELMQHDIGQLISYTSIANQIRVSDNTVRNWLKILKAFYYCFEIRPWYKNISKSLKKEPKYYLWDWSACKNPGAKLENFVASHLLKTVHFWTDYGLGQYELYYLRDKNKKEVDFLITKDNEPWMLIEVKTSSNQGISPNLYYYQAQTNAKYALQVVLDLPYVDKSCFISNTPIIVPLKTFLSQLI